MFADLRFEGRAADRDALLHEREQRAAMTALWIAVLSEAAAQPPDKVLAYLEAKKREVAAATAGRPGGIGFTTEIDQAIARARTSPEEVADFATRTVAVLQWQRTQLLRHQPR